MTGGLPGISSDSFEPVEYGTPSFSAYSLYEGRGTGDAFRWTDPAPAGEEEPLLG